MSGSNALVVWDVIVIGGGPAGMMAASIAAGRGKRVLLLEKNPSLGKKLLITGGGRCNVTNNKPVIRTLAGQYRGAGKFLFSAFAQHAVPETIEWFATRGVPFIEENEGRLFPESQTAQSIYAALVAELKTQKVTVRTNAKVRTVTKNESTALFTVTLGSGEQVPAATCVFATGGTARPETGATGDGLPWLVALGHTVNANNFALVPLVSSDTWTARLSGVTVPAVRLSLYADSKKVSSQFGKILFTHVGLSGPTILNMSKTVGELLAHSTVVIKINLLPALDAALLKSTLQALLISNSNKKIKNVLRELIPAALVVPVLELAQVAGDSVCHSIRATERTRMSQLISALPIQISGLQGAEKAVISGGGVVPTDINFKTMESRRVPGVYIIGDVIDIDRPSGGYSLQLCWTTGYVAGTHIL